MCHGQDSTEQMKAGKDEMALDEMAGRIVIGTAAMEISGLVPEKAENQSITRSSYIILEHRPKRLYNLP